MLRPTPFSTFILLVLLVVSASVCGDRLRVTTWNLNYLPGPGLPKAPPQESGDQRLREIAFTLSATDADVLLLQEIPNLAAAERLASLLNRGPYRVLACSQFADGLEGGAQVAVLSRLPALNAGTERWRPEDPASAESGFAFATVRIATLPAVVYSVRLPENPAGAAADSEFRPAIQLRESAVRQLLGHVDALQPRISRARTPVILGGDMNTSPDQSPFVAEQTLRLIEQTGFSNAYGSLPLRSRITRPSSGRRPDATFDYVFARDAALVGSPHIGLSRQSDHLPVTVDYIVASPVSAVAPASPTAVRDETSPAPAPAPTGIRGWLWFCLAAGLCAGAFAMWRFQPWVRNRSIRMAPISRGTSSPSATTFPGTRTQTVSPHSIALAGTNTASSEAAYWQERALSAERRAQEAVACAQPAVAPHVAGLLKDEVVSHLLDQRTEATHSHETGAAVLSELEDKLATIQTQTERRIDLYEQRIAQLEAQLAAKEEVTRQLLATRIEGAREALRWLKHASAGADPRRLDEVDSRIRQAEEAMLESVREAQAKIRNEPGVRFSTLMARRTANQPNARDGESR